MIEQVLIAVDGSVPSRRAARYGLALAAQARARVTLLSVLPPAEVMPLGPLSGYLPLRLPTSSEDVEKIKGLFAEIAAEHPDVKVEHAVELGPVSETICTWAEHHGVDLIVLGARGLSPARQLLLGSVSQQVALHAPCAGVARAPEAVVSDGGAAPAALPGSVVG